MQYEIKLLQSMGYEDAATEIGTTILKHLIPSTLSPGHAQQWSEIRMNIRNGGIIRKDNYGYTLLHACAEYGHEAALRELIRLGAYVNAYDCRGDSPLGRAVIAQWNGHHIASSISRVLLENGAYVNFVCVGVGDYDSNSGPPAEKASLSFLRLANEGHWPWPETTELVKRRATEQSKN